MSRLDLTVPLVLSSFEHMLDASETRLALAFLGLASALAVAGFVDFVYDSSIEGLRLLEVIELAILIAGLVLLSLLWARLWRRYRRQRETAAALRENLGRFRARHGESLAAMRRAIDAQFSAWSFSPTESAIARQLILGHSFKEIAAGSGKSTKTVQNHATAIYQKSGMVGRSDLAAFFLADLFDDEQTE